MSLRPRSRGTAPRILSMVLAGGEARPLLPLTLERAAAAVPFAGRYRLVDVVLSNFVNSGLSRIKVLTQYKSASLEQHIARAWRLSPVVDQFIETIPAQQRTGLSWFKGSADAVFQCFHVIEDEDPETVVIFGGDHVFKMDIQQMLARHFETDAELTIAAVPVPCEQASRFGVIDVDAHGRVVGFVEKPTTAPEMPSRPGWSLASMGNYVFKRDVLKAELSRDQDASSRHDFGGSIIPGMVTRGRRVVAYDFTTNLVPGESAQGYWRDVGSVHAYFDAHMDLVDVSPEFNLYNPRWPIRTGFSFDPPAKFEFSDPSSAHVGIATDSLVSDGCVISGGQLDRSVLSPGVRVSSFAHVERCVLMEGVRVGRYVRLRRVIVDKDVDIPDNTQIGFDPAADRRRFTVTDDGIVVIPKHARLES